MAKSSRAAATERAAQMRAEATRKDRQRKQVIAAVVAVVVIIIAVTVGSVIANRPASAPAASGNSGAAALTKLTSIPAATFDAAAAPAPQQAPAKVEGASEVKVDGKPRVLYVGAEFCPYCAIERWALIAALSRFGSFEGITETTSSSADSLPDTPTFSFLTAKYTSDSVAFAAVETQDREGKPLQKLEGDNATLFQKNNPKGNIPWISWGGTHSTSGATVDGTFFEGKTYDQIITGILDPKSDLGKSVLPAANVMTAQLCAENGGKPTNVCTSSGVLAASVLLKK